jgi:hypothetical protein
LQVVRLTVCTRKQFSSHKVAFSVWINGSHVGYIVYIIKLLLQASNHAKTLDWATLHQTKVCSNGQVGYTRPRTCNRVVIRSMCHSEVKSCIKRGIHYLKHKRCMCGLQEWHTMSLQLCGALQPDTDALRYTKAMVTCIYVSNKSNSFSFGRIWSNQKTKFIINT